MDSSVIKNFTQQHKKLLWIGALALAVVLTLGIVIRKGSGQAHYLTAPVRQGNITATVEATGTINPLTTVPVGSYVSGTVKYIFADFNTRVRAGQVLAQLDPAIYQAQVSRRGATWPTPRRTSATLRPALPWWKP